MTAPLRLDPRQVAAIGTALAEFTETTRSTGVRISRYGDAGLVVGDCNLRISWDDEARQYVIDDQIGS